MTPEEEKDFRRELGKAMLEFIHELTEKYFIGKDDVMRQVITEKYRRAVETAAARGIEVSLPWHTLAVWTEDGKERIGFFSRALECLHAESAAKTPQTLSEKWNAAHTEADCLYEIGRIHAGEGSPEIARGFFEQALPFARQADALHEAGQLQGEASMEGKILALLLQLPDSVD